ncbi:exopolysaccharide biosynthesis protein [Microvirga makkahensis]|uniref:Exopolysaccharide biosynthesis protein n=1 Tax=Microvirga makkahensis TaxID=1128670 RepID=A0A7X3MSM4_9HYPH|nr:exopolysaccharide biosynthesis protein [Microvirga makkahensis]MXQ12313.1 hypothetical protein [Microvirga makkahensis]
MTSDRPEAASKVVAAIGRSLPPNPRLSDLVDALGEKAGGILLAIVAVPAIIPVPGVPLGAVFGTVLVILAYRMVGTGGRPWLPQWLGQVRLGAPVIVLLSRRGPVLLRHVEHRLRPRAGLLVANPITPALAAVMALMGTLIALPIPFGNTLPGLAVILMGLGLAARDGLAVLGALILAAVAAGVSIALGWAAVAGVIYLLV